MFFKAHTHESRCQTERCSAFNNFLHHKKEQKLHEVASGQFITRSVLISQTSSRKPLAVFHPNTDYKIFPKDRWKFHINHEGNVLFAFHWRNLVSWSVMHVNARWKSDIDVQGEDSCSCSTQAFIEPPGLCCFLVMLLQSWNAIRTDMLYTHTHTHMQRTRDKLETSVPRLLFASSLSFSPCLTTADVLTRNELPRRRRQLRSPNCRTHMKNGFN